MAGDIRPDQVGFLSFEGGGRAGLVIHPGVVQALAEPQLAVLRYDDHGRQVGVQGFAGSSSGSVIATLVSCGYTSEELFTVLSEAAFDLVFRLEPFELGQFCKPLGRCTPPDPSRGGGLTAASHSMAQMALQLVDDPAGTCLDMVMLAQSVVQSALPNPLVPTRWAAIDFARRLERAVTDEALPPWLQSQADGVSDELKQKIATTSAFVGRDLSYFEKNFPTVVFKLVQHLQDPANGVTSNPSNAYNLLKRDFGIFPGCAWRSFLDHLIAFARFRVRYGVTLPTLRLPTEDDFRAAASFEQVFGDRISEAAKEFDGGDGVEAPDLDAAFAGMLNTTFEQHLIELYPASSPVGLPPLAPPPLAISGANLSSQESHLFDALTTPWFCVADAVRIATSLPPLFKPVVIEPGDIPPTWPNIKDTFDDQHFMTGHWIDGGVYWNSMVDRYTLWETSDRKTLGIGIGIGARVPIHNLTDFAKATVNVVYERNVSATRVDLGRFVVLDNLGIEVTGQRMSAKELAFYRAYGRLGGYAYFGLKPPPP